MRYNSILSTPSITVNGIDDVNLIFNPWCKTLPYGNLSYFWDTVSPQSSIKGPDPEWSYAGALPDGTGGLDSSGDPVVHDEGLWCGPAYTNEFQTTPIAPEIVTLLADDYTLVMTGDGSVTSSYGTATEGSPLQFTASAGNTTFTPTDTDSWLLVKSPYVLPVIPPASSVVSAASSIGGEGVNVPMDTRMLEVFRGEPDGIELVTNGNFDTNTDWNLGEGWTISDGVASRTVASGFSNIYQNIGMVTGGRYQCTITVLELSGSALNILLGSGAVVYQITTPGTYTFERIRGATNGILYIQAPSPETGVTIDNVSVQKLQPATMTLAALVHMGVGSDELPFNYYIKILSTANLILGGSMSTGRGGAGTEHSVIAGDGTTSTNIVQTWSRNEIHLKIIQTNSGGTQFRVGNKRYNKNMSEIDTDIVWSSWVAFDGSFDPLEYLRYLLDNTVPMWMTQVQLWSEGEVAETEIIKLVERYHA